MPQVPRTVKLGDILPSLGSFESVLQSLKSYPLWPVVLREALMDRATSGIVCSEEEWTLHGCHGASKTMLIPLLQLMRAFQ